MLSLEHMNPEGHRNILLSTDVYKMGHMEQFAPGTTKIYSNIVARSEKKYHGVLNFGTQYYLMEYLSRGVTPRDTEEFLDLRKDILGATPEGVAQKMRALAKLGYVPLRIKAAPEGYTYPIQAPLLTAVNTLPEFAWVTGFFESLLLKIWNTCTVATYSKKLKTLMQIYADVTCENRDFVPFQVHDFGYRGCSSEETAALSGMSHLVNFLGTDTVSAVHFAKKYYNADNPVGLSVPASEHSVMCSFGPAGEFQAFEHMLDTYPEGIVSIVADTYNLWTVLENFAPALRDRIRSRKGKVVFRPDSGDQTKILCGDPNGTTAQQKKGVFQSLAETFGFRVNSKGFKELSPEVGVIYGDGFWLGKFTEVFDKMKEQGWASNNLCVGVGGLLLQQHNRDDLGFSMKATYIERDGQPENIYKDPITDPGKKSHKGMLRLDRRAGHGGHYWETTDQVSSAREAGGALETVFEDGVLKKWTTFQEIRERSKEYDAPN